MDWTKSYLFSGDTTSNCKRVITIPAEERNEHHKRAKWLLSLGTLLMLTIFALPLGVPLFLWGMREANKAERLEG